MAGKTRNFLDHLHPTQVRRHTLQPATTCGLGLVCLTCLAVLLATGMTLFLYYVPEPGQAYERILHITTTLRYGGLVRNLHYVSANALLVCTVLHLARVFCTASYKGRRLNWLYGLGLLLLVLLANFTGYLLPWNQVSYWAIKVGASLASYFPAIGPEVTRLMLGGDQIGPETLIRSFALHGSVIPALLLALTALHLWRIRKDGGIAAPPERMADQLPARPWLYRAEGSVALLSLSALLLLALWIEAPIFERANPFHPPNPAKAPWYFVGFQEMVSYSALAGGVAAPAFLTLYLIALPFGDRSRSHAGIWFSRDRWPHLALFWAVILSQVAFIVLGQWLRGPNWTFALPF